MKKILGVFGLLVLMLTSCDIIEGPYLEPNDNIETNVEFPELNRDSVVRKILFEEFTGHYCTNCPERGHRELEKLIEEYGSILVPVTIHAGGLATPREEPFSYDFTTETGNKLYNDFGVNSVPCAMINRVKKNNSWVSIYREWPTLIDNVDKTKIVAGIQLINEYKQSERVLIAHTKTTMLEQYENPIMICVILIENDFVSPQLDAGNHIMDYVHNHVLRTSLNGTYGAYLNDGKAGLTHVDSAYTKSYKLDLTKITQDINYNNCFIVTYIYDAVTKEVLQVEHCKVVND